MFRRALRSISASTAHKVDSDPTLGDPSGDVFGPNSACVHILEVTECPDYVTGEIFRTSLSENQEDNSLYLQLQVLDVNTGNPVSGEFVEIWQTNVTGVYGSIISTENDNSNDTINDHGVADFVTIIPDHYHIRTVHTHVMEHINATVVSNNTIDSTTASHVGQMFFDQFLLNWTDCLHPYGLAAQDYQREENAYFKSLSRKV